MTLSSAPESSDEEVEKLYSPLSDEQWQHVLFGPQVVDCFAEYENCLAPGAENLTDAEWDRAEDALAKRIFEFLKASDQFTEESPEELKAKRYRLVRGALKEAAPALAGFWDVYREMLERGRDVKVVESSRGMYVHLYTRLL